VKRNRPLLIHSGHSCRLAPMVVGQDRNGWSLSTGISGRFDRNPHKEEESLRAIKKR